MNQFSDKVDDFEFLGQNLPKNAFWGRNFKNLCLDSKSVSLRYYVHQFSDKTDNFDFSSLKLPKNGFSGRNFKNLSFHSGSASSRYLWTNFERKATILNFWAQIYPKLILGLKFQKYKSGFRSSILEILCVPIFRQREQV